MNRLLSVCVLWLSQLVLFTQVGLANGNSFLPAPPWTDSTNESYTLTLNASPTNAGSFNRSSGNQYEAGSSIYMYAYNNSGYVFDYWMSADTIVSTSQAFYFTMPDHHASLTAVYHFNPSNPPNPEAEGKKYTLTLCTAPANAGSFNRNSGEQFTAGQSVYMYYYNNNGYKFDYWMTGDTIVSKERYFNFIMPSHDAELTAVYHFDPNSPADPDTAKVYYNVTLNTQPGNAGSFSWNTTTGVVAGNTCDIYAYSNTGYIFREWQKDGETVGTDRNYRFTMPAEHITLTAVYEFNPSNPSNPNKNYWNEETGEVIVDDFTAGNLSSAVNTTIGGSSNRDKVQMITVAGPVSQYDWGVVNNYSNCTFLDMSRTNGLTYVPSYNFSGNTVLTTIVLPASIESIQYYAFNGCSNLSSLSCYAATPPTIGNRAFEGVQDGLVVYVPADALSLYQEAEGWKDFTILPLSNQVSALEVNLPENTDLSLYKDMYIELINAKSGQKQRYVITNRLTYTFNSLIHRTSYNVYLKNAQGDVLGEVDGIDITDHDVSVVFESLLVPRDLTLKVLTPAGQDVTDLTTITWMDYKDTYLTKGNVLTGQIEGAKAKFRIALPQSLGMEYLLPVDSLYEVQTENSISYTLTAIPQMTIAGKVTNVKTGLPLSGATVTISQMLNGLYSKAFTTKTDAKGEWQQTVYEAKTDITASMTDYVSKSQSLDVLVAEVPAFELKDINGTTISLNLTYTPVGEEMQEFYSDYANVAYSVFNETTKQQVTELNVQYPQIVLMEQLPAGTELTITATSKNQKFVAVTATAIVDSLDRATVTLPIKQLGGINASFKQTDNTNIVGILYDGNNRFVKKYDYNGTTLTISELTDGEYTLVTMANSQFFNSVSTISQFADAGLREGIDFVKNSVKVTSGAYTAINNQLIPYLDESKLYYTGENTYVAVNKSQITVGNYLTFSGHLDFKSAYADAVSDVKLIVDLPENCAFVDNSVMVGSSTSSYTYDSHRLIVPLVNNNDRVRFCFIPTEGGEKSANASVQFALNGKEIIQPIGNVNFMAKDLSVNVPSTVAKTIVPVSGTAVGKSKIEIFDNNECVGQAISLANGSWATTIELGNSYNLSTHDIYAKVTTPAGIVMQTGTQSTTYNKMAIQPLNTVMSFYNGWLKQQISLTFDFENGKTSASSYMFYTGTDITFVTNLSNNDTTIVSNVFVNVFTDKNDVRRLSAVYDKNKDRWIATSRFESNNLPVNVSIDFVVKDDVIYDREELVQDLKNTEEAVVTAIGEVDRMRNILNKEVIPEKDAAFAELAELMSDTTVVWDDIRNLSDYLLNTYKPEKEYGDDELNEINEIDSLSLESIDEDFFEWVSSIYLTDSTSLPIPDENGSYLIKTVDGAFSLNKKKIGDIDISKLEEEGYKSVPLTEGGTIYYLYKEDGYVFINTSDSVCYQLSLTDSDSYALAMRRAPKIFEDLKGCIDGFKETTNDLKSLVKKIKSYSDVRDILPMVDNLLTIMADMQDNLECLYDGGIDGLVKSANEFFAGKLAKIQDEVDKAEKSAAKIYKQYLDAIENAAFFNRMEKEQRAVAQGLYDAWAASTDEAQKKRLLQQALDASKKADGYLEGERAARNTAKIYLEDWQEARKAISKITGKLDNLKSVQKATMAVFDKIPNTLRAAKAYKSGKSFVSKIVKFVGSPLGTLLQAIPLYLEIDEMITELGKWSDLYHKVSDILPCPGDSIAALQLFKDVESSYGWHIAGYGTTVCADAVGMALDFATVSWIASLICDVYSLTVGWFNNKLSDSNLKWYEARYNLLNCTKNPEPPIPPLPPIAPIHDPSGYVYEGVASNRLQGVTATAYYKETVEDMYGDLHENVVLWDAEQYAQENPLFTDEYGMYQWDVPQGLWQVKFEKEGYQTTYSEWLPVPPPQLEVNIPMTQMLQPTVKSGKAFADGVEFEFDKYMDPETLTADNIMVTKNGNVVKGEIKLLNEEVSYASEAQTYASKVRFEVPEGEELMATDEVQLTVRKAVTSYAGIQMENDYTQKFDVELQVRRIAVDSLINVAYGGTRTLTIAALPTDAAKGKMVNVKSLSSLIATSNVETLTLDENGQAELIVTGELPGSTVLNFKVEGTDVEELMTVNVKDAALLMAVAPRASRVSGTEVYRGTKIQLTSETENAVIYYTLDGTCPCDANNESVLTYNPDEPIIIADDNVTIKAMATGYDLGESDVAEFTYSLKKTAVGYQMPEGWSWISHNLEEAVPTSIFQTNAERIVSQTAEIINDPKVGFIGNLTELQPAEAYKVKVTSQTENRLSGYEWNATENAVAVESGWNWIGYPLNQAMTLAEALAFFTPSTGDYIVGQDGYAEYADDEWKGTLETFVPGHGYLFKSGVKTEIPFNTTIVSDAVSRIGKKAILSESPWAFNKYAWKNVMPVTAQLYVDGIKADEHDYIIGAFAGSDCRGVGQWKNGRLLMSVYGDGSENIRFVAHNVNTDKYYDISESINFSAENVGTWYAPYVLTLGNEATGIEELYGELTVTPLVAHDYITVSAGGKSISHLTLTNLNGVTVLSLSDLGKGATITTGMLTDGVYILTVQAEGKSYYKKILKANK